MDELHNPGTPKGIPIHDAFIAAAKSESPVDVSLGKIDWPQGLAPAQVPLGGYKAGEKIAAAVTAQADVLVVLYTDQETSALLDVFTGDKSWTAARKATWCGYAHNFDTFKSSIEGIADDTALKEGMFGYLSAMTVGNKRVVLFKSDLHPKQNGKAIPFIPVLRQLIAELAPKLVISTGTAGAIGDEIQCGDVVVASAARFHLRETYPKYPGLAATKLSSAPAKHGTNLAHAAANYTKLSLPGLSQCCAKLQELGSQYSFVKKNTAAPKIHVAASSSSSLGPQPVAVVSGDYITVDDNGNHEKLQALGTMNDTDDAFLFYAIENMSGAKPNWLSVRNASEPQIVAPGFAPGTTESEIESRLGDIAGAIYGIYQYCTTLNSAFACWGLIADS